MGVLWQLSDEQLRGLNALMQSTTDARVMRNVMVILLSSQGRSKERLVEDFGLSVGTVNNIRRGYRLRGLAGLKPQPRLGRRSRATPKFRDTLRSTALSSPQSLGYRFRAWSAPRLAHHLERETGLHFGEDQIRRFMRQEGVPTRPYRTAAKQVARPAGLGPRLDRVSPRLHVPFELPSRERLGAMGAYRHAQ
jgi:transposase